MKVVITGANGTIGSKLKNHLESLGHTALGWNRQEVPINDYWAMENFLKEESPDVLYHLAIPSNPTGHENESWLVNYQWTSELAWITKVLGITFVFSSTVMVYTNNAQGPFSPEMAPDAAEGYGYEKRMAEERVFYQNTGARIVRLGWQIGDAPGSNNMVDFLETRMNTDGLVSASTQWFPACSFLEDTVEVLARLPEMDPGLYHFDSNDKWTFYQIAFALNTLQGKKWKIVPSENFVYDQRMEDDRLPKFSLKDRLKSLK